MKRVFDVKRAGGRIGLTVVATALGVGAAHAQTMNANSASMNAGYGRVAGQENRAVAIPGRDANGNAVIIDGLIMTGQDQSSISSSASGAVDAYAGVGGIGSAGASAIGNNLTVVTQGNYNTVIVSSKQTNNGSVTANATTSGGVGNAQQ